MYKIKFVEIATGRERILDRSFPTYDYAEGFLDGQGYVKKDGNKFHPINSKIMTVSDDLYSVVEKQKEEMFDETAEIIIMEDVSFYDQLVCQYKRGIDPETNLLASERELIEDAIAFVKHNALLASAYGKQSYYLFVFKQSTSKEYPRKGMDDKVFDISKFHELLNRSPEILDCVRSLFKARLSGNSDRYVSIDVKKSDQDKDDYTIKLSWYII